MSNNNNNNLKQILLPLIIILSIILIFVLVEIIIFFSKCCELIWKYYFIKEKNLPERYGKKSFVLITGSSSGQGKQYALEFAKRGFGIVLTGSEKNIQVQNEIREKYPNVGTKLIIKDFSKSFEDDFFDIFEQHFQNTDISVLVNNVGHRTAWKPYHEMPVEKIRDTIACGTIVQARLTHIALAHFLKRKKERNVKSAIINVTAQCMHKSYGLGSAWTTNEISVPFLSTYEACNAFGYYHSNSIFKEYKDDIDILTVTPGAVITENTKYLKDTMFQVDQETLVGNVIKFMGNVQGITCGCIGHEFSEFLVGLFPFMKDKELEKVGHVIANEYMNQYNSK